MLGWWSRSNTEGLSLARRAQAWTAKEHDLLRDPLPIGDHRRFKSSPQHHSENLETEERRSDLAG